MWTDIVPISFVKSWLVELLGFGPWVGAIVATHNFRSGFGPRPAGRWASFRPLRADGRRGLPQLSAGGGGGRSGRRATRVQRSMGLGPY